MDLFSRIESVPPILCRLLARKGHGRQPMSNQDIADRGGIARVTVAKVSMLSTWDGVGFRIIRGFFKGCGVDPLRMAEHREFLKGARLEFMENASPAQRAMFDRILRQLKDTRGTASGPGAGADQPFPNRSGSSD